MALWLVLTLLAGPHYHVTPKDCYDGDTCRVDIFVIDTTFGIATVLTNQAIRLCDIDAPELVGATRPQGEKARDWLKTELFGAKVTGFEPSTNADGEVRHDKYGRLLGWLWADGDDMSVGLVASGHAVPYIKCAR